MCGLSGRSRLEGAAMSEFVQGVLCGAGGLVVISALIVLLLIWRAPVIEDEGPEGWGI